MLIFHTRAAENGIAPAFCLIGMLKKMFLFEMFTTSKWPLEKSFSGGMPGLTWATAGSA
jgi:hypothetical protein